MTYYIFVEDGVLNGAGMAQVVSGSVQNIEVSKEIYDDYIEDQDRYIYDDGQIILNPDYEEVKAQKRRAEFEAKFFNTSLGWVRRQVTMKNGEVKDFLTDILPLLQDGVYVLTYTAPDFSTDAEPTQNKVSVTELFINECKQQLLIDFYGANS